MEVQRKRLAYENYHVGVVCALTFELSAVRYMLDLEHERLPAKQGDSNIYIPGELSGHNVVLTCLPGNQGKSAAATVATNMSRSFPQIKYRLLVGIGGGVPNAAHDIRLGDVVIGMPDGQYGGVVQYDLGSDLENDFRVKGFLHPPPTVLRSAVQIMRSDHLTRPSTVGKHLSDFLQRDPGLDVYKRPPPALDILFNSDYPHDTSQSTCDGCKKDRVVIRRPRDTVHPRIHYGLIASGDRVMKSAAKRSALVSQVGDILCFEMEAAGLLTELPCIVIRGISDYADSHKNDSWQHYSAAAAAGCAKELLSYVDIESIPSPYLGNHMFPNVTHRTSFCAIGLGRAGLNGPPGGSCSISGHSHDQNSSTQEVLREDLKRMAGQINDSFVRSGFEMAMRIALKSPERLPRLGKYMSRSLQPTPMDLPSNSGLAIEGAVNREGYDCAETMPQGSSWLGMQSLNGKRNAGRLSSEAEGILGKLSTYCRIFTSDKRRAAVNSYESETSYTLYPAEWVLRLGIKLGIRLIVSQSLSGWKCSLEPIRVVSNDSLVMTFCKQGNLDAIRTLFERGEASPNDTITFGWTLLHISSFYAQSNIIEFLLDAGADPLAMTCESGWTSVPPALVPVLSRISPLDGDYNQYPLDLQLMRRTPREEFDFEQSGLGIFLVKGVLERYDSFPDPAVLRWLLREFFEDMCLFCPTIEIAAAVARGLDCEEHHPDIELLLRILEERGIKGATDWDADDCWDYWCANRTTDDEDEGDDGDDEDGDEEEVDANGKDDEQN